jgi:formate hydrogenlyase subunit 4
MLPIILILITSLFFTGIIGRVKSLFSGRKGPGILQPLKNVFVLFRKGNVYSNSSSIIFQIAPTIAFCAIVTSILFIPVGPFHGLFSTQYDFVMFAYLLAVGRFFMIIGALDTASSFEGMGANREAFYGMLLEPAFFIIMASLCLITGYATFNDVFITLGQSHVQYFIPALLSVFVFTNIAVVENSRLPVDDPKTHLELTMIHEVMILDNSGFDLALIHITSFIKFAIFGTLMADCIINVTMPLGMQIGIYFGVQILFASVIGFIESFRARNRLNKNLQYILAISAVALVSFILTLVMNNKFFE